MKKVIFTDNQTTHPSGLRREKEGKMNDLQKVKFNPETNEFYGNYGEGMIPISQEECYRFVNSGNKGVKCLGGEGEYVIYGYR